MSLFIIQIDYQGIAAGVPRSVLNKIKKIANIKMGVWWHQRMRPRHFTEAGARQYRYTPRTKAYTRKKIARFGHNLPLVFTGKTRALTRVQTVRATSNGVRIVLNAPALNFRNPKSKVDMRDEATRLTPKELRQLTAIMARTVTRRLGRITNRRRVRL